MPSQLLTNDKVKFVVSKRFTSRGKDYEVGDDFDQAEARNIESFVRARYVIPVVDDIEDKKFIRQWHKEIRPKDEVLSRLFRDRAQLRMHHEPDSEEVVSIEKLVRPNSQGKPLDEGDEDDGQPELPFDEPAVAAHKDQYDPSYHTVVEVNEYLAAHPEERERILEDERGGKNRKGILEV
jgi:hypothetical protein